MTETQRRELLGLAEILRDHARNDADTENLRAVMQWAADDIETALVDDAGADGEGVSG